MQCKNTAWWKYLTITGGFDNFILIVMVTVAIYIGARTQCIQLTNIFSFSKSTDEVVMGSRRPRCGLRSVQTSITYLMIMW